ncbi:MAG TPA: chaperone modulator CbpM [Thermodesulfobacteriota bacterium]
MTSGGAGRDPEARPLEGQVRLGADDLCRAVGIRRVTLARLVRLAVVDPIEPGADEFPVEIVPRLRRMVRLHRDLGIGFVGAAVAVDLLARIEALEAELARLRRESLVEDRR